MLVIIQARISSARLPGKVLREIAGSPILQRVYDRVLSARNVKRAVVATSTDHSDLKIRNFCESRGIPVFSGSLRNVAKRLLNCAIEEGEEAFVRISADSPLIDPLLIDKAIEIYKTTKCDLVSNVQTRSFPKGQSVEVIKLSAFKNLVNCLTRPEEQEHVTTYFYQNTKKYKIKNFSVHNDSSHLQLSVDTKEDFEKISKILNVVADNSSWKDAAHTYQVMFR